VENQLKNIAALVRACPIFHDIRGYYPQLTGCVESPFGPNGPYRAGTVHLFLWSPEMVERTSAGVLKIKDKWHYNRPGAALHIRVNAFGDLSHWFYGEDEEGRFYELPPTRREIAGFPVIGDFLLMTPPNKSQLFTPITRERAQRWIIANLRKQADADASILDSARKQYEEFVSPAGKARRQNAIEDTAATLKNPEAQAAERRRLTTIDQRREQDLKAASTPKPGSPQAHTLDRLSQLEPRLAAMPAEQRRQPAWYKSPVEGVRRLDYGDIVDAGSPGARPLVTPNEGVIDKSMPKTTLQVAYADPLEDIETRFTRKENDPCLPILMKVIEQMDWRALAAMLK
jgi:hypothetical protein